MTEKSLKHAHKTEKFKHTGGNSMDEVKDVTVQNDTQQITDTGANQPTENSPTPKPDELTEKTISKKLFDEKVSELNRKNKELQAQLKAKMTDDERKSVENDEREAEMQAIKNELAALKTESAFVSAGVKPEIAKELSAAIVGADASAIVEAVKSAIATAEKDAAAKTTKELLENGSPKIPTATGSTEKPDPNVNIVKNAVQKPKFKPLQESKWCK